MQMVSEQMQAVQSMRKAKGNMDWWEWGDPAKERHDNLKGNKPSPRPKFSSPFNMLGYKWTEKVKINIWKDNVTDDQRCIPHTEPRIQGRFIADIRYFRDTALLSHSPGGRENINSYTVREITLRKLWFGTKFRCEENKKTVHWKEQ